MNFFTYELPDTQVNYFKIYLIPFQNEKYKKYFDDNIMFYHQFMNDKNKNQILEKMQNEIKQNILNDFDCKEECSVIFNLLLKCNDEYSEQ